MDSTRRTFLQASGMAAVLGATGFAGCQSLLGGGGSFPAGDYQYDPSLLTDSPNVVFLSMNYGELYSMRDQLPESMQDSFEVENQEESPVDMEDVDQLVGVGGGDISTTSGRTPDLESLSMVGSVAITGSFDRQAVVDEIESQGEATQSGDYEGYTLYEVPNLNDSSMGGGFGQQYQGSATFGIGDSAMIVGLSLIQGSSLEVTGEEAVRTMVDASAGNARRLNSTDGPAQDLQSRVNDDMIGMGVEIDPELVSLVQDSYGRGNMAPVAGMIEGIRGIGFGGDVDPQTTTFSYVLQYDSASSAENSGVVQILGDSTDQYEQREGIDSVTVEQDGKAIVAEITGDTETIFEQGGPTGGTFAIAPPSV